MQITVSELAALVGGQLASQTEASSKLVTGAASLAEARAGDVTFYANPKYLTQLRASQATVALVPADFSETVPPLCIRCEDPAKAFAQLLARVAPPPITFAPGIHPTAVIGEGVVLGEGVSIQPYAVIESGAIIGTRSVIGAHCYIGHEVRIGEDCTLRARVTIEARCVIGNRVILHSGVVIGADGFGYEMVKGHHVKVPQTGIVQIDDDVEIGANTCIDRARFGRTWIGTGTKIDNLVQIGHNVQIGAHSILCGQVGIAGSARLGKYVTLGGQVGVNGHIDIGDQSIVAGKSGIAKSLPGKEMYFGSPAIPALEWKTQLAWIAGLGKLRERVKQLERALGDQLKTETGES